MSASPTCQVKIGSGSYAATTNGVNVSAADALTVKVANASGVNTWSLTVIGSDDGSTATGGAAYTVPTITVNAVAKTATLTAPSPSPVGNGCTLILQSVVNGGIGSDGQADSTLTTTFSLHILTTAGVRLVAYNQTTEANAAGWIKEINAASRGIAARRTPIDSHTLLCWTFDEQTAGTSTFANSGTGGVFPLTGGLRGTGILGGCASFYAGASPYHHAASSADTAVLVPPTDQFTISLWVYLRSYESGSVLLTKAYNPGDWLPPYGAFYLAQSGARGVGALALELNYGGSETAIGTVGEDNALPLFTWNHLAVTFKKVSAGGDGHVYLLKNGVVVMDVTSDSAVDWGTGGWWLGDIFGSGLSSDCMIDDVRIENVQRSAGYLAALYALAST